MASLFIQAEFILGLEGLNYQKSFKKIILIFN
jgi:hypothetical protein